MSFDTTTFKCVVIGDGAVGKTSMLVTYAEGQFPDRYVPTGLFLPFSHFGRSVFDNFRTEIEYSTKTFSLQLWDTAGQEEYAKLRKLSYPDTDVFMICFSVVDRDSFRNIDATWIADLQENLVIDTPKLLIGCKLDLREDPAFVRKVLEDYGDEKRPVTTDEGVTKADEIGAFGYIECSAKTGHNLHEVFRRVIQHLYDKKVAEARAPQRKGGFRLFASMQSKKSLVQDLGAIDVDIDEL